MGRIKPPPNRTNQNEPIAYQNSSYVVINMATSALDTAIKFIMGKIHLDLYGFFPKLFTKGKLAIAPKIGAVIEVHANAIVTVSLGVFKTSRK